MTKLFENISEKNILKLKRILKSSTAIYRKNVNVLSNVNMNDFIALIDTGSVQLIYNDYDGNNTVLEELQEGEFFGSITYNVNSDEITCITKIVKTAMSLFKSAISTHITAAVSLKISVY